jgi:hypothetical protein
MESFTQLGIAGATLLILLLVVRYFISAMDKKDEYIQKLTEKFSDTVNNHLANENASREQEREALTKVIGVLDEHTKVLASIVNYNVSIDSKVERISRLKYGRRKGDKPLINH